MNRLTFNKLTNLMKLALLALMSPFFFAGPAQAAPKSWQVSEVSGEVSIESGGAAAKAKRGSALLAGDTVTTGADGRAVIVRGGEYVIVSPESSVQIAQPNARDEKTQIFQAFGSAMFKIEKKESWNFGVKTPYLAAVVKGTTFNVTVTSAGATVQVTEGKVEVSTLDGGAVDLMVPGRIARVDATDKFALKVLGTGEKVIRSEAPGAVPVDAPKPEATPATGDAANVDAPEPQQVGLANQPVAAGQSAASNFVFVQPDAQPAFSGQVSTAIGGAPVSVASATGGLVGGGQSMDQLLGQVTGAANAATNGNAAGPALTPVAGNGNGPATPPAGGGTEPPVPVPGTGGGPATPPAGGGTEPPVPVPGTGNGPATPPAGGGTEPPVPVPGTGGGPVTPTAGGGAEPPAPVPGGGNVSGGGGPIVPASGAGGSLDPVIGGAGAAVGGPTGGAPGGDTSPVAPGSGNGNGGGGGGGPGRP